MKNETINKTRFAQVFRHEWEPAKYWIMVLGCLYAVWALITFAYYAFYEGTESAFARDYFLYETICGMGSVCLTWFLSTRTLVNTSRKRSCISFMTMPATACEKFTARLLTYVVFPFLIAVVGLAVVEVCSLGGRFDFADYCCTYFHAYALIAICLAIGALNSVLIKSFSIVWTAIISFGLLFLYSGNRNHIIIKTDFALSVVELLAGIVVGASLVALAYRSFCKSNVKQCK